MNVAFIPVRGGSKSIPLKNIKAICGKPLVYWCVKAAVDCSIVDKVYVSTDSERIKTTVETFGFEKVEVIGRGKDTATDMASTESAMLEFAHNYTFDNIILIQATSPLTEAGDLEKGFSLFFENDTDSVLSVVRQKRFNWEINNQNYAAPINYNVLKRPRRQDFDGYLTENGAFYITSKRALLESGCRISGRIRAYEMRDETFFEIDEPEDWLIIESLLKKRVTPNVSDKPKVKMFLTDCDGCLTDGGMYYSSEGEVLKKFNTKDGLGISLLKEKGIITGIITGEDTPIVVQRAKKIKVDEVHLGVKDKLSCVKQICEKYNITLDQVAYIGDDINDLEVLSAVGISWTVANGNEKVKRAAMYVTKTDGGEGAVREAAEWILENTY